MVAQPLAAELKIEVQRVFAENFGVYGVRKVWRQLRREGFTVARCTVERLMASLGLQGAIRGKPVRTTISDKAVPCPLDHVQPAVPCAKAECPLAVTRNNTSPRPSLPTFALPAFHRTPARLGSKGLGAARRLMVAWLTP
jgi:hypothetical protein